MHPRKMFALAGGECCQCENVTVTAPLIDIAYGDSSLQLVGGYPCGGSRPVGRCPCAEGVRLPEREARTPKGPQGAARTRRTK